MSSPAFKRPSHRVFGFTLTVFLCVLTGIIWLFTRQVNRYTLGAAGVVLVLALILPRVFWPLHRFMAGVIAPVIGGIQNKVILGTLFYVVVAPAGVFMRWILGRDPLALRPSKGEDSYFRTVERQVTSENLRDVF